MKEDTTKLRLENDYGVEVTVSLDRVESMLGQAREFLAAAPP
jgi:hypothetical protein